MSSSVFPDSYLKNCSAYIEEVNKPISDLFVPVIRQEALLQASRIAAFFKKEFLLLLFSGVPPSLSFIARELNQEAREICWHALCQMELAHSSYSCQFVPPLVPLSNASTEGEETDFKIDLTKIKLIEEPLLNIATAAKKLEQSQQLKDQKLEDLILLKREGGDMLSRTSATSSHVKAMWFKFLNFLDLRVGSKQLGEKIESYQYAYEKASRSYLKWVGPEGKIIKAQENIQRAFDARKEGPEASLRIIQDYFNILGRIYSEEEDEKRISGIVSQTYATENVSYNISLRSYSDIVFKVLKEALPSKFLNKSAECSVEKINDKESLQLEQKFYFLELFLTVAEWNGKEVVMKKQINEEEVRIKFEEARLKIESSLSFLCTLFQEHTKTLNNAIAKTRYLLEKKRLCELKFGLGREF